MMKRLFKVSLYSGVAAGCVFLGYNYITPPATAYIDRSEIRAAHKAKNNNYIVPSREAVLEKLENTKDSPYDVLIIGGGATGAGAALDAATRGMNVALVEKSDFAQGTSSRATKMARTFFCVVFGPTTQQLFMQCSSNTHTLVILYL